MQQIVGHEILTATCLEGRIILIYVCMWIHMYIYSCCAMPNYIADMVDNHFGGSAPQVDGHKILTPTC